jgi:hypothetical protein
MRPRAPASSTQGRLKDRARSCTMLFQSPIFLFLFLPVTLCGVPLRRRSRCLVSDSCFSGFRRLSEPAVRAADPSLDPRQPRRQPLEYTPGGRISDATMDRLVPKNKQIACTGKRGTVVLADTCSIYVAARCQLLAATGSPSGIFTIPLNPCAQTPAILVSRMNGWAVFAPADRGTALGRARVTANSKV